MLLTHHLHQIQSIKETTCTNAQQGHAQQSCYSMLQSVLHSSCPELTTIVELDTACSHQKLPCKRQLKGVVQHGMQTQHVHVLYDMHSERCMVQKVTLLKMIVMSLYLDRMLLIPNQSAC